jgi:protein subunit release factor B
VKPLNIAGKSGFTLTRDDFVWEYFCAGGKGGQKQNKTASACRVTHPLSGATGISRDERSQPQNRKLAFGRLKESKAFQNWCKVEMSRRSMLEQPQKPQIDLSVTPENTVIEVRDSSGKWIKTI